MIRTRLKVKDVRTEKGFSQRQLARKSGVSLGHISELESGKANPSLLTLDKLAAALNVEVFDLLDRTTD